MSYTIFPCPHCRKEPNTHSESAALIYVECCGVRVEMPTPVGTQRRWNEHSKMFLRVRHRAAKLESLTDAEVGALTATSDATHPNGSTCAHGRHPGFDCAECQPAIDASLAQFDHIVAFGEAVAGALPHTEPSMAEFLRDSVARLDRTDCDDVHQPAISLLRAVAELLLK